MYSYSTIVSGRLWVIVWLHVFISLTELPELWRLKYKVFFTTQSAVSITSYTIIRDGKFVVHFSQPLMPSNVISSLSDLWSNFFLSCFPNQNVHWNPHREHFIIVPLCSKAQQASHNSNIKLRIIFHVGIINRIIVPIKEEDVIKIDINFHHTTLIQRKMIMTWLVWDLVMTMAVCFMIVNTKY